MPAPATASTDEFAATVDGPPSFASGSGEVPPGPFGASGAGLALAVDVRLSSVGVVFEPSVGLEPRAASLPPFEHDATPLLLATTVTQSERGSVRGTLTGRFYHVWQSRRSGEGIQGFDGASNWIPPAGNVGANTRPDTRAWNLERGVNPAGSL